jgi:hypothetical protein
VLVRLESCQQFCEVLRKQALLALWTPHVSVDPARIKTDFGVTFMNDDEVSVIRRIIRMDLVVPLFFFQLRSLFFDRCQKRRSASSTALFLLIRSLLEVNAAERSFCVSMKGSSKP